MAKLYPITQIIASVNLNTQFEKLNILKMMKNNYILKVLIFVSVLISTNHACKKDDSFHQVSAIEKQIHDEINKYRSSNQLNAYVFQPLLFMEARAHSLKMKNGAIEPGYEGLDLVFEDFRTKLGGTDGGAIVELTDQSNSQAVNIVNLFKETPSKDSLLLGAFNQAGVGFVTGEDDINYITVLFFTIPPSK
jgi:uncharacterized protein YkwD